MCIRDRSKDDRTAYGSYQNVFLSTEELISLQREVPHYPEYIEKLSSYMASSGKLYSNHAATIRSWALPVSYTHLLCVCSMIDNAVSVSGIVRKPEALLPLIRSSLVR